MWTYSGDPTASPLDEVRFLTGDTIQTDQLAQDGEIAYAIKLVYGNTPPASGNYLPAAYVADSIHARLSRYADKTVGDLSITYSQRAKNFSDLASKLRQRATLATVPVYAGGMSLTEKRAQDMNLDRVQPATKIDGMSTSTWPDQFPGEPNLP